MALQGLLCPIDSFLSFVARFVSSRLVSSRLVYGVIKWYVKLRSLLKIYNNKATFFKFKVVQLRTYVRLAEI